MTDKMIYFYSVGEDIDEVDLKFITNVQKINVLIINCPNGVLSQCLSQIPLTKDTADTYFTTDFQISF